MNAVDRIRSIRGMAAKIAEAIGINQSAITRWTDVPANRVPEVERITGIPRHEIRPDLWDKPKGARK